MKHAHGPLGWTTALALVLGTAACGSRVDATPDAPAAAPVAERVAVQAPQAPQAPPPVRATTPPPTTPPAVVTSVLPPPPAPAPVVTVDPDESEPLARPEPEAPEPVVPRPVRTQRAADDPRPAAVRDRVPARFAEPQDRYALLVGIQHYRSPTRDTVASIGDIALIKSSLLSSGWLPQNIRVLVDDRATGDAIRDGMNWLQAKSQAGRTFSFFHYSGHVKQFGGQSEALWPIDRDWLRDTEVATQLAQVRGRMWVDIAGCEAGSFLPGLKSDRVLFSGSSTATQKSYEHPGWGTSVWTGLLFRTAAGRGDADQDGRVTVGEALRYARHFAPIVTARQTPHGPQNPVIAGDPARAWTLDRPPA